MKSSIKEDKEVLVLSEELLSDNALLQYRQTSTNEVSVVIRYIKSSSIKEITLFKTDPKNNKYLLSISDDKQAIAVFEEEEKGFVLIRLFELENHSFESSDFIDLAYNKHFDKKIGPTLVLKGGKSYGKQCKN